MDYECQTIPIDQITVNASGILEPLCTKCKAPDCTNPIRKHTVCLVGITKEMRLWVTNNAVRQVVACKGYIDDTQEDDEEDI